MNEFLNYLSSRKLSKKSLKNYKSDISHFTEWVILKIRSFGSYINDLEDAFPFLSASLVTDYMAYMQENATPPKTINRRLSTLRNFSKYLIISQIMDVDFMSGVQNITFAKRQSAIPGKSLLTDFRSHLEAEKVSYNTIKNYVSDVKQFLEWLENNESLNTN